MSLSTANPWLHCPRPSPNARLRLYAFPYAGGGASVYFPWAAPLAPEIEVWAVRLPGRETRLRETAFTSFDAAIGALQREVAPHLRPPYAFFGHSLGAMIALSFAQNLYRRGATLPRMLVVGGARAPSRPNLETKIGDLPDAAFWTEMGARYNGIPPVVLAHPELRDLVLPILRADARLYEDYRPVAAPPLPCALTAFGGKSDPLVSEEDLAAWRAETTGPFLTQRFDGDHFFLQSSSAAVLDALRRCLASSR